MYKRQVFDGGARRNRLAQARANVHAAEAQSSVASNQIADEVWTAYSNLNTAFRQRQAALALSLIHISLQLVEDEMKAISASLAHLAKEHRDTPMIGRSNLQQAVPLTFGYKAAVWLAGLDRHLERLDQMKRRVLMGEFGGAVGTLASLGKQGLPVQQGVMAVSYTHLDVYKRQVYGFVVESYFDGTDRRGFLSICIEID